MANRLGFKTTQLPSFSDANQASAQALSLALKGAQLEEQQRKEAQQNLLGKQLGDQLLAGKDGGVNQSDLLNLALNTEGSVKDNLGMLGSLQDLLETGNKRGKLSDAEKELAKLTKHKENLEFKQKKEDRARFAKLPELAQSFAQPFVDRVSTDFTPFMRDEDKFRAQNALVSAFMETGGDPKLIDLVRRNAESSLKDEDETVFDTDFDVNKFNKGARADIANAIQLQNKLKR